MTADVRTFRAPNMQAALDIVRREMGQDAVILQTRHVDKRRLLFFGGRSEIEVTAGLGTTARGLKPVARTVAAAATVTDLAPPPPLLPTRDVVPAMPFAEAVSTVPAVGRRNTVEPPKWSPNDVIVDLPVSRPTPARVTPGKPAQEKPASTKATSDHQTLAQRFTLPRQTESSSSPATSRPAGPEAPVPKAPHTIAARARQTDLVETPVAARPSTSSASTSASSATDAQAISQRLDTLQRMILELGKDRTRSTLSDIPGELFPSYTQLLDNDVNEDIARELVCKTRDHASRSQVRTPTALQSVLTGMIEQEFRVGTPIKAAPGRRKVVALVGPTGVGKTTTLAKLAANLRLKEGVKVGLITVDTYRIAAVEQLKTYAELIDLPMKVVTSPDEMRTALEELSGLDLVLIDTAGRSPRDDLRIQELKDCLDAAQADEVHLVLSLASGLANLESVASKFQTVGVTSLILTKLDETTGSGVLLDAARQLRTPVSYLTTGQNVPEDIEVAQRTRMARLVTGAEQIS